MSKNTSFVLGDHFDGFIVAEVSSGRYGNASDVMRAALRLLEQEEKKLDLLRAAIDQGDRSPEAEDVDGQKAFTLLRRKGRLTSRKGSLADFFRNSPLGTITFERTKDLPRSIDL